MLGDNTGDAVKDLAAGVDKLIRQMRAEQKVVREWADEQAQQQHELAAVLRQITDKAKLPVHEESGDSHGAGENARAAAAQANYWPGFVDMLSTLLLVVTFLMSLFMLTNYFVTTQTSGKDTMLSRLNRQLAELTELLALERSKKQSVEDSLAALQATLIDKDKENERLTGLLGDRERQDRRAPRTASSELSGQLDEQKQITNEALAKVEMLNQQLAALRLQLAALQEALEASEAKDKESQAKIADLGQRLNVALAKKVQELARYRSDFFGKLREVLGARPDFQIVGDRFVFPSDVLFDSGSAELKPEAMPQIDKLADALKRARDADSRPTSPG